MIIFVKPFTSLFKPLVTKCSVTLCSFVAFLEYPILHNVVMCLATPPIGLSKFESHSTFEPPSLNFDFPLLFEKNLFSCYENSSTSSLCFTYISSCWKANFSFSKPKLVLKMVYQILAMSLFSCSLSGCYFECVQCASNQHTYSGCIHSSSC
jgi:hypothetical protein